jgi:type VI secretion system secreted protein Hcp
MRILSAVAIAVAISIAGVAPRALADTNPATGQTLVRFVPPPTLASTDRPTASDAALHIATATVVGMNASTRQTWTTSFPVSAVDYPVATASAASGLPTGQRMHKPIVITADLATAAPFMSAMLRHDLITSITITFAPPAGTTGTTHTLTLADASIATLKSIPGTGPRPSTQLTINYQKITWTWSGGKAGTATE